MAKKKKVGIALGGGAARGIAHVGVLEILEQEGIPIDVVAGTSAGAIIGALYASGMSPLQIKDAVLGLDWKKRRHMVDIALPRTGFIAGERLMQQIQEMMGGNLTFDELKKPFACVACDLATGEEVVMNKGPVAEALRASMAIPVIFQAVKRNGHYLIDGGMVNQVPINVARAMGADYVIAVNVTPAHTHKLKTRLGEKENTGDEGDPRPNLLSIMLSVIEIANSFRIEASLAGANIIIEPHMTHIGPVDFHKDKLAILQGEMAAIDAVLSIKRDLARK
jgi:NTE family protein